MSDVEQDVIERLLPAPTSRGSYELILATGVDQRAALIAAYGIACGGAVAAPFASSDLIDDIVGRATRSLVRFIEGEDLA